MTRYSKEFNEVVDTIEASGTEQEKVIISMILGPKKDQQVAITDAAQSKQLSDIVGNLVAIPSVAAEVNNAEKEGAALQAQVPGQQAQGQQVPGQQAQAQTAGYSNKTRRQYR